MARQQRLTDDEKIEFLIPCIKGDAAVYLCDIDSTIKGNFNALVEQLHDAYEVTDTVREAQQKLQEAKQGTQTIQEYQMVVAKLSNQLGDMDSVSKTRAAGEAFLKGVNDQVVAEMIKYVDGSNHPNGIPLKVAVTCYKRAMANKPTGGSTANIPPLTIHQLGGGHYLWVGG